MSKNLIVEIRAKKPLSPRSTVRLDENKLRLIAEQTERELLEKAARLGNGETLGDDEVIIEWR